MCWGLRHGSCGGRGRRLWGPCSKGCSEALGARCPRKESAPRTCRRLAGLWRAEPCCAVLPGAAGRWEPRAGWEQRRGTESPAVRRPGTCREGPQAPSLLSRTKLMPLSPWDFKEGHMPPLGSTRGTVATVSPSQAQPAIPTTRDTRAVAPSWQSNWAQGVCHRPQGSPWNLTGHSLPRRSQASWR